jgi:hypothetical protein
MLSCGWANSRSKANPFQRKDTNGRGKKKKKNLQKTTNKRHPKKMDKKKNSLPNCPNMKKQRLLLNGNLRKFKERGKKKG